MPYTYMYVCPYSTSVECHIYLIIIRYNIFQDLSEVIYSYECENFNGNFVNSTCQMHNFTVCTKDPSKNTLCLG